jgi:hypothetical protein
MRFLLREVAGWFLVLVGLWTLYECYELTVKERRLFEAGPLSIVGIVVFRGGIHLLKVAVAARLCREAKEQARADKKPRPAPVSAATRGS